MKTGSRYRQFCPVAKGAEIFAEPWTPLLLRELLGGSRRFSELHKGVPRMSQSLLAQRLKQLEDTGLIEKKSAPKGHGGAYHLTQAGEATRPIIEHLGAWGYRWVQKKVTAEDLDASLLMWDVQHRIATEKLPAPPLVLHFHFPDADAGYRRFWLLWDGQAIDTCLDDPGRPVDLAVHCKLRTMTLIWLGDLTVERALRSGELELVGARPLQRQFPQWLRYSLFAVEQRQAAGRAVRVGIGG
jgi:DNA-binding HxlR family transcriptional regulator